MKNERKSGSNILRRISPTSSPPPSDPLERAREYAKDVRDISRDQRRRELPAYDDTEESTARHDIPTMRLEMVSRHESEPPAKKIRSGLIALGTGVGLALI